MHVCELDTRQTVIETDYDMRKIVYDIPNCLIWCGILVW